MAARRRSDLFPPQNFTQMWHGLPWNGLFWLIVLALLGAAAVLAAKANSDLGALIGVHARDLAEIADGEKARVVLILNGDELVVEKDNRRAKVRMLGIKSFDPVVNEREITAYGDASVRFLSQWILDKEVALKFDEPVKDEHGRYLAYVYLDDIEINRRMIAEGVSMAYTQFATARERDYLMAELQPRKTRVGIWGGRKASARILGLRRQWYNSREARGEPPVDPLLEELR